MDSLDKCICYFCIDSVINCFLTPATFFYSFSTTSLPLKRTGQAGDMGEAIYYLLTAMFCTGVILDVDGGHGIRQYANPVSDPMRQSPQKFISS